MGIKQPIQCVCVDLIVPHFTKANDGTILDFMCLTMDPTTRWFKIIELPNANFTFMCTGQEIAVVIIDKSSVTMLLLFNNS